MNADRVILRPGWLAVAVTTAICLFPVFTSSASPAVLLDPDRQFQFAEHYFQEGEYYRAIGEYERFIFFFPEAKRVELASYRVGLAYLKGERYQEAIQALKRLIEQYQTSVYAIKSYFRISEAYVQLGLYDQAFINLENLITIACDQDTKDEAYYQSGWICFEKWLWEDARTYFDKISPRNREKYKLRQLSQELDKKKLLKRKNPSIAGLLAIVPGAGHLYCKRYKDALVSFLVNAALILAAYDAFDHDCHALGGIITIVEVGFYGGNIYSAVNSAHKYNLDEKDRFLRYLKERARISISLGGPQENKALMLSCQLSF